MSLWLVRAGSSGEYENKFLDEGRIYLTWNKLNNDISKIKEWEKLIDLLNNIYPDSKIGTIRNWASQIWPFAHSMEKGDWVILPSKKKSSIHIGEIKGKYINDPHADNPYFHYHDVDWFAPDIPRSNFDQDILYSLGAFLTVCRIHRNDAEDRIKEMSKNSWKVKESSKIKLTANDQDQQQELSIDLDLVAKDQIAKFLLRKFKGHGMAKIINSILQAQGYTTYISPEGPDKGVDILAAPGPMGFGNPRICVQVKSSDAALDRSVLDQLIGTMHNFNADQGLLVSWGGFKSSIEKEIANQFFKVRLWDQDTIIEELLASYDKLDDDIKTEIPLKRQWILSLPDDE